MFLWNIIALTLSFFGHSTALISILFSAIKSAPWLPHSKLDITISCERFVWISQWQTFSVLNYVCISYRFHTKSNSDVLQFSPAFVLCTRALLHTAQVFKYVLKSTTRWWQWCTQSKYYIVIVPLSSTHRTPNVATVGVSLRCTRVEEIYQNLHKLPNQKRPV